MIIGDFYIAGACFTPHKTNSVLFIDANAYIRLFYLLTDFQVDYLGELLVPLMIAPNQVDQVFLPQLSKVLEGMLSVQLLN
jgi:hypothetical protein